LPFSYVQGGALPSSQTLSVSTGSRHRTFTVSKSSAAWLSIGPTSGTTPASVTVSVKPGTLAAGTYSATITVTAGGSSVRVPVTLNISAATQQASLRVSPSSLSFSYQQGGTAPASQTLSVSSSVSTTAIAYTDTPVGGSWFSVNRTSGTTPSSIGVSVNPGSLAAGSYSASIGISSSNGSITVPVSLTVSSSTSGGGGGTSSGSYTLLTWSELGMHCMDGKDYSVFSVLPPYNTIHAQLLKRGNPPTRITSGVTITYQAGADTTGSINSSSAGKTNFWNYAKPLFHANLVAEQGLAGYSTQSKSPHSLTFNSAEGYWEAIGIPTMPYDDKNAFNPLPMAQLVARDPSGKILASANIVVPVSDEMTCKNCHGSGSNSPAKPAKGWVYDPDPLKDAKLNILKKHDDRFTISAAQLAALKTKGWVYKASLYQTATACTPVLCSACHADAALSLGGIAGVNPLSQDMHRLHGAQINPANGLSLDKAPSDLAS
jgi:hypothetical protein